MKTLIVTTYTCIPGPEGQSEVSLIANPEAMSLSPVWSHTFVEYDHDLFSTVIHLLTLIQE